MDLEFAADYLRDVQQIVHQLQLSARVPVDHFDGFLRLLRSEMSFFQESEPSQDRVEGCSQFVRKRGEKLILHLTGFA